VQPDQYTYNSVVGACARGGQFDHAVRVVQVRSARGGACPG
jgi:pentatricopeptide repeat protein